MKKARSSASRRGNAKTDIPSETLEAGSEQLDLQRFLALPLSAMAEVSVDLISSLNHVRSHAHRTEHLSFLEICMFLQVQDLTRLARTSTKLRRLLMSKVSKPCWDAARYLQNMPEWTGVAAPRAAAFIFDDSCQVGPTRRLQ